MRRWSLYAALGALFFISWWVGCSNPNLAGGKLHFDQASRLEEPDRSARFRRALQTFGTACQEMPKSGEARLWLGQTYAELDRPDSAATNFDLAEELDPLLKDRVRDVRDHYYSMRYNGALTSAGAAAKAKLSGDDPTADAGFRDALKQFYKAAVYSPRHPQVYTMIGKVYLNLAQVDSALTMLQKARDLAPGDEKVRDDLYAVYRDEGDKAYGRGADRIGAKDSTQARTEFQNAMELYRQADSVIPDQPDLSFQMAATAYELSQLVPESKSDLLTFAIDKYETVLAENPVDVDVLYNLVLVLRDVQRFDESLELAKRLVDLKPKDGTYREILGRIHDQMGKKEELLAGLVFGRALKSGMKQDIGESGARADAYGPNTEIKKRYLENGPPDEILTFTDTQGTEYEVWFYWKRGMGYGFVQGREKFSTKFVPTDALEVAKADLVTKGATKYLVGIISNASGRKYSHVRAEFTLLDDQGERIGRTHVSTEGIDPHGNWSFEIPLTGAQEQATSVEKLPVLGY